MRPTADQDLRALAGAEELRDADRPAQVLRQDAAPRVRLKMRRQVQFRDAPQRAQCLVRERQVERAWQARFQRDESQAQPDEPWAQQRVQPERQAPWQDAQQREAQQPAQ
jgi:hypothetical protein